MSRASAQVARMSTALVVVLGVLLLHSLPMTHPPGGHSAGPGVGPSVTAEHPHGGSPAAVSHLEAPAMAVVTMSSSIEQTPEMAMGMCMAVVAIAAALLLTLTLAPRSEQNDAAQSRVTSIRRHLSRAPPWAGPSLEKLSVLRI